MSYPIQITLPLALIILSSVSTSAQAQLNRHIGDPLNLATTSIKSV